MRIAFVGEGGSGETTAAAAFSRYLATAGRPVLGSRAVGTDLAAQIDPDYVPGPALPATHA